MRNLTLATTLMLLAACDGGPQFAHTSTLHQDARGVALTDGDDARVGMSGTTCDVDPEYAAISTDYDYPGEEDTIHDNEQGKLVIVSDDQVHIQDRWDASDRQDFPLEQADYTDAVAIDGGAVMLGHTPTNCHVSWTGIDGFSSLKPEICDASPTIAADPVTGTTWVGTADSVSVLTPDGDSVEQLTEDGADLMVFDSATELMYVAVQGDNIVRAMDLDGIEQWATDVLGGVNDLEDFGDRGSALVTVQYAEGGGALVVIDGLTGEITSDMGTPDGQQEIVSSEGGSQVALMRDSEVHFYEVYTFLPTGVLDDTF